MTSKLYVGSLSYEIGSNDLEKIFSAAGTVKSAKVITEPSTGQSKGFGFVEMSSSEEAQRAIKQLNGTSQKGRNIVVNEAQPERKGGGGGGGGRGGDRGGRFGGGGGRDDRGGGGWGSR